MNVGEREMMVKNGRKNIGAEYGLQPFEVLVLEPVRTICEKIMSLVRFSYFDYPIQDLKGKIRHVYDLHKLLSVNELSSFFEFSEIDLGWYQAGRIRSATSWNQPLIVAGAMEMPCCRNI